MNKHEIFEFSIQIRTHIFGNIRWNKKWSKTQTNV